MDLTCYCKIEHFFGFCDQMGILFCVVRPKVQSSARVVAR